MPWPAAGILMPPTPTTQLAVGVMSDSRLRFALVTMLICAALSTRKGYLRALTCSG